MISAVRSMPCLRMLCCCMWLALVCAASWWSHSVRPVLVGCWPLRSNEHARGWLTQTPGARSVGTDELFSRHFAKAAAEGFVAADAAVIAMMKTCDPDTLPLMSWGEQLPVAPAPSVPPQRLDLYAIVDSADRVAQVLTAGVRTVQLRIKTPEQADARWLDALRGEVQRSVSACAAAGAELFINDHWQIAAEAGAGGVHLGQEDLLALGDCHAPTERQRFGVESRTHPTG